MSSGSEVYTSLIREGYLYRKSSYLRQWKSKWIILKGFCILIFNKKPVDHNTNDVIEMFDLSIYDQVHQINQNEFELYSISNINMKSTTFKANTNQETIEWINCIRKQQNKISINDDVNSDDETVILGSISTLIDDGFTYNETKLALQKSIDDIAEESDDDSAINVDITTSFDPRSMFEMEEQITKKRESESFVATALMSAINENIDEKTEEIVNMECNKQILNEINYCQVSSSVQKLLLYTNTKPNTQNTKANEEKNENTYEMKPISEMKPVPMITDISDLCVLATKQLQLLQTETNENMIVIKRMNLTETLNKIKQMDVLQYSNMMQNKQWAIFMENSVTS